ncbi:MAG: NADPH:quinone reductase [Pseudomonadota bacterium]
MRAAWYRSTGSAASVLTVGDLPAPKPALGEVLVRMRASGINPADLKRRAGWRGMAMDHDLVVPHSDGAGEIAAVGDGVPAERIGEPVWLWNAQGGYNEPGRSLGTAAEFCALPAAQAVSLPNGLTFADGACLGVPALTAHRAVFADGPVAGQTILVAGAAGAVAHFAVQFAAQGDARVIGTVSSEKKAQHARDAGAAETINYREEDVAARVFQLTDGLGVDRIIEVDFAANLAIDCDVIKPNGVIASYSSTSNPEPVLPYYALAFKGVNVRFVQGFNLPDEARQAGIEAIDRLATSGLLQVAVAERFPLNRIAAAHEAAEAGAIGTVVVEID